MILLQSLGNAGKQRSLNHIKSYLEPEVDVSVWRRVAVHSLRHFSCYEVSLKKQGVEFFPVFTGETTLFFVCFHEHHTLFKKLCILIYC